MATQSVIESCQLVRTATKVVAKAMRHHGCRVRGTEELKHPQPTLTVQKSKTRKSTTRMKERMKLEVMKLQNR